MGDLVLVIRNKVEVDSVDQIRVEVDAKARRPIPTRTICGNATVRASIQVSLQKFIKEPIFFMRLDIGVNAVAHSCNMTTLPSKGDKIGLVVTRINDNYEVAEGIITRLIKRCV